LALDLEDYRPSVLLHCWLGHLTCKIVSEMTYNVSSGTLNPTIPYQIICLSSVCHGICQSFTWFKYYCFSYRSLPYHFIIPSYFATVCMQSIAISMSVCLSVCLHVSKTTCPKCEVKASHGCYRALGPELVPVYRQSARR